MTEVEVRDWVSGPRNAITDIPGIRVGHDTDRRGRTGCTVILCDGAPVVAADTRGGAPGTREIDVLASQNLVRTAHAIVLAGGSAFGLAAADGVMRWCAERGIGFPTAHRPIPIVPAAVLYDLSMGSPTAFPPAEAGYRAASAAKGGRVAEGSVGAGTGATVAKLLGIEHALKGGLGTASVAGPRGLVAGALVAVNAAGSIFDPDTGACVAGPRDGAGGFVPLSEAMHRRTPEMDPLLENTTLICVATNATLDHHHAQRIAIQAHDGFARVVNPAHTFADGDTAFVIAMGQVEGRPEDALTVGILAARAVEQALLRAVRLARGTTRFPSAPEWLARRLEH